MYILTVISIKLIVMHIYIIVYMCVHTVSVCHKKSPRCVMPTESSLHS